MCIFALSIEMNYKLALWSSAKINIYKSSILIGRF